MSEQKETLKTAIIAIVGFAVVMAAVVCGSIYLASRSQKAAEANEVCKSEQGDIHKVTIQDSKVTPGNAVAPLCDTLTITNLDDRSRLMAFGKHEGHTAYDGTSEKLLAKGQSLTVTLIEAGDFKFHDHIQDEVHGTFTVTPK